MDVKNCVVCGKKMLKRSNAIYCSDACRQRSKRQRAEIEIARNNKIVTSKSKLDKNQISMLKKDIERWLKKQAEAQLFAENIIKKLNEIGL